MWWPPRNAFRFAKTSRWKYPIVAVVGGGERREEATASYPPAFARSLDSVLKTRVSRSSEMCRLHFSRNRMRSPVASHKQMTRIALEDDLIAFQCPESEGIFLPAESYFRWLSRQSGRLPHLPKSDGDLEELIEDDDVIKICPESGQIMQRYKVGHGFSFYLDRSPSGSIWLDKGEWQALKDRQFHEELHLIFTAPWQDKVRAEQRKEVERELLVGRFGSELLAKIEDLRDELSEHEHRAFALAYLQRPTKPHDQG